MTTSGNDSSGMAGTVSASAFWPSVTSCLRRLSLSSALADDHAVSSLLSSIRVQLFPDSPLAGVGMLLEQKMLHSSGSADDGFDVTTPTEKSPDGNVCENSVPAFWLSIVVAKPASCHWLCSSCCVNSRRLLPAVVRSTSSARLPSFVHTPSLP